MNDAALRENLIELLRGGSAHLTPEQVFAHLPPELRTRRPPGGLHSIWELLEHMRIAQEDILRYTLDPSWVSPPFPEGYWPANPDSLPDDAWEKSLTQFQSDLQEVIALVQNPEVDLTAEIPHGEGRTYLREILLVADHNAYHLGQIVDVRKALGAWPAQDTSS